MHGKSGNGKIEVKHSIFIAYYILALRPMYGVALACLFLGQILVTYLSHAATVRGGLE